MGTNRKLWFFPNTNPELARGQREYSGVILVRREFDGLAGTNDLYAEGDRVANSNSLPCRQIWVGEGNICSVSISLSRDLPGII